MTLTDRRIFAAPAIAVLLFLLGIAAAPPAEAQSLVNARNSALGGGGTAWMSGVDATFINPANLFITDRTGRFHISFGNAAHYMDPVYPLSNAAGYADYLRTGFLPYRDGEHLLSLEQRQAILDRQYGSRRPVSENRYRTDLTVAGALWQWEESAFSLVLRTRQATRIETGKGWYTSQYDGPVRDMTLRKQKQSLVELSAGFAREFTFLSGLSPGLGVLLVGIAPKVVAGGAYTDFHFDARYGPNNAPAGEFMTHSYRGQSSGPYSDMIRRYRSGGNALSAIEQLDSADPFSPEGYGAGFDMGLTWFLPLGSGVHASNGRSPAAERSLRFGFSVTDLGMIRYDGNPLTLAGGQQTELRSAQAPSSHAFTGADGQYLVLLENASNLPDPVRNAETEEREAFTVPLPASVNAGALLDLSRMRVMADISLGLSETAFNTPRLRAHFGMELRPLPFLPVRAGARMSARGPMVLSMGGGVETRFWDLQVSARALSRPAPGFEFTGGAFAGLQFHF